MRQLFALFFCLACQTLTTPHPSGSNASRVHAAEDEADDSALYYQYRSSGSVPAVSCAEGEDQATFSLQARDEIPEYAALNLPPIYPGPDRGVFAPIAPAITTAGSRGADAMVDFCIDQDQAIRVARIVYRTAYEVAPEWCNVRCSWNNMGYVLLPDSNVEQTRLIDRPQRLDDVGVSIYRLPVAAVTAEGLEDALFGDPTPLKIAVAIDDATRFALRSFPVTDQNFMVARLEKLIEDQWRPHIGSVLAGGWDFGNPFGDCSPGHSQVQKLTRVGTTIVTIEACIASFEGGNSTSWIETPIALTVDNTAADDIPAELRQLSEYPKERLDGVLHYYSDQHHHFDDGVYIEMEQMRLAFGHIAGGRVPGLPSLPEGLENGWVWARKVGDAAWTFGPIPR